MSLAAVTSTRQPARPIRIALFGVPGVGKTTFAAQAPSPIFLCVEDGAGFLDAKAFPKPLSWQDTLDAVEVLLRDPHDFKTLVIDTLDALESLCWEHVCRIHGNGKTRSIEDFGYGRGYQHAVETWEQLLRRLEQLQVKRGMHLVLVAHAVARDHKDPDHDAWKRWAMKLHSKSADVIAGWVDAVLFAAPEMVAKKEGLKTRGFATGERLLYTEATGSHEGKNRYGLPPILPLDWEAFWKAARPAMAPVELNEADARQLAVLKTDATTLIGQLPEERQPKAREALAATVEARDLPRLKGLVRKLNEALSAPPEGASLHVSA